MFRSLYDGVRERRYTDPGERFQDEFLEVVLPDGSPGLEKVGQVDLWELHQQDKDSCDLTTIVARYQSGDINALDGGARPVYYDRTLLPDDPVEAAQLLRDLRTKYGDLGEFLSKVDAASKPVDPVKPDSASDVVSGSDIGVDPNKEVAK